MDKVETIKDKVKDYTIGEGRYKSRKDKKAYDCWNSMMRRVYLSDKFTNWSTYKNTEVCQEWHNFQNFAEFYYDNIYKLPNSERVDLDKDILQHGQKKKIYSPDTVIFCPHSINSAIALMARRNQNSKIPIGVYQDGNAYIADCGYSMHKRIKQRFDNPIDAFNFYKQNKEKYIKDLAEKYREWIPKRLYDALMAYEIREDD